MNWNNGKEILFAGCGRRHDLLSLLSLKWLLRATSDWAKEVRTERRG